MPEKNSQAYNVTKSFIKESCFCCCLFFGGWGGGRRKGAKPWVNANEISARSKPVGVTFFEAIFWFIPHSFFISFCQGFCLNTESRSRSSRLDLIETKHSTFNRNKAQCGCRCWSVLIFHSDAISNKKGKKRCLDVFLPLFAKNIYVVL